MAKGIKYHTYLVENYLKDSGRASGYLREAILEGELDLLRAVIGDLTDAGYEGFKVTGNKIYINGKTQNVIDVEMTQKILKVNS